MNKSFDTQKQALIRSPAFSYPSFCKPPFEATDVSSAAVGAVLSQICENVREHPILREALFAQDDIRRPVIKSSE